MHWTCQLMTCKQREKKEESAVKEECVTLQFLASLHRIRVIECIPSSNSLFHWNCRFNDDQFWLERAGLATNYAWYQILSSKFPWIPFRKSICCRAMRRRLLDTRAGLHVQVTNAMQLEHCFFIGRSKQLSKPQTVINLISTAAISHRLHEALLLKLEHFSQFISYNIARLDPLAKLCDQLSTLDEQVVFNILHSCRFLRAEEEEEVDDKLKRMFKKRENSSRSKTSANKVHKWLDMNKDDWFLKPDEISAQAETPKDDDLVDKTYAERNGPSADNALNDTDS
ncbi:hypothetical protein Ciccas_011162 [Cichlidogyrus casuarinus]|uniref:Uncharacterized protein n=1 Tax=Cichlidogyrus casuarinus TaxID=1844966 RepID=A0ABD2PS22_9PLAT